MDRYNELQASVHPRPLTIGMLRRALLHDFGVDAPTQRRVLSRYDGAVGGRETAYLRSQTFKTVMHYLDEIAAAKADLAQAAADRAAAAAKWKRVLTKAQLAHRQELARQQCRLDQLLAEVDDLRLAVKGLTCMLSCSGAESGAGGSGREGLEEAFERFQAEIEDSAARFRLVLVRAVAPDGLLPPPPRSLDCGLTRAREKETAGGVGSCRQPTAPAADSGQTPRVVNEVASLRERFKRRKAIVMRGGGGGLQSRAYNTHIDPHDHAGAGRNVADGDSGSGGDNGVATGRPVSVD